ncbi:MAG: (2Fe-2S)-binding protein [Proteobacteria bacterium]|nr:(2Fe-2S)-binding protein [Pseudomonadota bacterium]
MTPFRIRERLKELLGLTPSKAARDTAAPSPRREKVTLVLVDGDGNEQTYDGGAEDSPLFISGNMKKPIGSGCNDSTCATCRIEVLEGAENLSPQDDRERNTLKENGHPEDWRLGCRVSIMQGTVKVRAHEFLEL